ncbi:MAG: hypothetical protein WCR06_10595 [bacterium]
MKEIEYHEIRKRQFRFSYTAYGQNLFTLGTNGVITNVTSSSGLAWTQISAGITNAGLWQGTDGSITFQLWANTVTGAIIVATGPTWSGIGASNITATSAMGYATLSGTNADVYLFWDTSDKGTNSPSAWSHTNYVGANVSTGLIEGVVMSNLTSATAYRYRFYGTNTTSGAIGWSDMGLFITLIQTYDWTNSAGGTFATPGNWNPAGPPAVTEPAMFGLGAVNYTVNFGGAAASSVVLVTNQNAVTFDLGGYTYTANDGGQELCVGSNATDNVKLTITRGRFSSSGGGTIVVGANNSTATLQVDDSGGSAGSVVLGGSPSDRPLTVGANGTLIVSGPGSYVGAAAYAINAQAGSLIVLTNGGALSIANMDAWGTLIGTLIVDGAGSVLTNYSNLLRMLSSGAGMATVRNGGRMQNAGTYELGVSSGSGKFMIGNGSANTSIVEGTTLLFGTTFDPGRGSPEVTINSAGLFRATATANSVFIYDLGTLTMNGGIVELTATGQVIVADINSTGSKGLLRGSGTFKRYTGTTPFAMLN